MDRKEPILKEIIKKYSEESFENSSKLTLEEARKKIDIEEHFYDSLKNEKVNGFPIGSDFVDKNGRVSDDITGATEALFVNMDDKVCMSADRCGISISRIMALPRKDIKENRRKKKKQEEPSIPIVQRKP